VKQALYYQYQQNPYNKLNSNKPNSYSNIINLKSQQQLKIQEIKGYTHEVL